MDDAPVVWIERSDLLRQARLPGFIPQKEGHLAKLRVLAFPEIQAVDHDAAVGRLAAEPRVDDVLQGVQCSTLAAKEDLTLLAIQLDT